MARFLENTKEINKAARKQRKPKQQKPKQQKPKQNTSANKPASNKPTAPKTGGSKNKAGGSQYSVKQDRQITSRQTQAPKNNSVNRNTRENTNRATQRYSTNVRNGSQYSVANSANRRATRNYKQQQNNRFESRKNELKDSNILKSTKTATNNDIRRMGGAQYKVDNSSREKFAKRVANLTEGSVKQVVGGHLTSISHQNDRTGYDLEMERITDLYKKGRIDKTAYETEMKSLQEREKQGKKKSEVYESKARAIQDAGDKQVQEGMKGLSGISKIGAEAYNSLIGMGMDMTLGPASLVGMASRTYGNSLNSLNKLVKKGVISAEEAERYAAMQSAKEVGTELLFKGAGAAAGYAGAGKVTEKLSLMAKRGIDKATQRINNNVLKNVVSTGLKLGQGAAEEATEEAIAGLLDAPITNIAYANRLDKEYRGGLKENGTSINSQRDQMMKYGYTKDEATAIFVDELGSDDYLNELAQQYIDDGMSEKRAFKQAKNMQEYMIASLNGDEKTMQALEDKMAEGIKAKFSLSDTLEAMAAAGLMTAVTGGLGSVNTMAKGEMYKNIYAKANGTENAAEAITKIAKGLSDKEMAARATAMYEHASQGKELSYEQYVELGQAIEKQAVENSSKAQSAIKVARNQAESEGFYVSATPQKVGGRYAFGHNSVETQFGSVIVPEGPTQQRAEEVRKTAYAVADQIEAELGTALDDKDALVEEITAAECGFASGDIVEYLTDAFPENRAVYEAITGVKLPADNAKMRDAVFTRAIEKNVEMAKAETIERIDLDTGNLDVQYANDFGGEGQQLFHALTNNISTRDKETSIRYRTAFREIYDAGRTGASLDAAMEYARDVHNLDKADVIEIFNAGIKDKDNKDIPTVTYNVSDPGKIKNSEREVFLAFSRAFGVNIVITDDFTVSDGQKVGGQESVEESNTQVNGMYYDNTIYLNLNDDIHKSVGYTIMHELTHNIEQRFPAEYKAFADLFKQRWIEKNGQESFDKAIKDRISTYDNAGAKLTEEDALSEIIADQMAEVLYDEEFISNIAEEHPNIARAILDSIRDIIRKIRQLFANYGGFRSEFNEATLSQLDMLKDAEALLMKAIQAAQDGRVQEILNEGEVNAEFPIQGTTTQQAAADEVKYSIVTDKALVNKLDSETKNPDDYIVVYRAMAKIDGKYYPPMSSKIKDKNGKWNLQEGISEGDWVQSDITTNPSMFNDKTQYILKKDDGKTVPAAYNPYIHSSETMLNDQFASAYTRPNMVTVKGYILKSDVNSDYRAEHDLDDGRHVVAKDSTGLIEWKAGVVQGKLSGTRKVYLSQYFKLIEEVPENEVAQHIKSMLGNSGVEIPYNVVTPGLRKELLKAGVPMKQSKESKYRVELDEEDVQLSGGMKLSIDSEGNELSPQQSEYFKDSKVRDEDGNLIPVYHGTNADFNTFKHTGSGNYFTANLDYAKNYGGNIRAFYLDIKKPFDVRDKSVREDYVRFVREGFSSFLHPDTKLSEIYKSIENGVDWNEADNLIEWFEENGLDYDGLVLYEGGDLVDGKPVSRGLSYVTLNSNQSKLMGNDNPTSNPDIRFSIVDDSNSEYNVDELKTSLKERFKEYETDEGNLKLATEVVADIGKIRLSIDGDTDDVRRNTSGIRTIAKGISEQFINEGYVDFRGRKVNGPEDVAAMMQVCRDPRFETFRIILVKGNKVVSVRNMSSRLPGVSVGVESTDAQESFKLMKDRMRRSQADGYYLVHNHPSGKVEASSGDKMATAMYINNVRGFKGHIILDHNKYGLIENIPEYDKKSGYTLPKASEVEMGGQQSIDFMNIPEVEHRMLGKSLGNKADSVANTIKQLQTSKTASIVLYADSQLKVREIQEIDNAVIENQKHLKSYIFNEGVRCGARFIFVGAHKFETYSVLREMVKDGVLTDAFLLFDNIDARSARVDDSITPLVSEDDIANNRRVVLYDGTKEYESNSLSEVIPSKESVIKYSINNPWDTSWFDGMLDDEEVNTRGDKNKSIAEISAEFTNIVRDNAKLTGGKILDRKSIKKQIGELVKMTTKDTTYTAKEKREIANFLVDTAEQIWSIVGEKRPIKLKQEEIDRIINLLYDASDYVISNAKYINDTMLDEIIEFKKFFRGREVGVSAGARAELADDWDTIRKRNIGRVRFVSAEKYGVTNIADALIQTFPEAPEISLLYGREVEEALEIGDEATLVRILDDVLSNLSVVDDAIKSEYAEDFRVALSQDFARIVLNEGEAWESKMDRFKDRYEQRIKDLRARQKEAVRDLRSNYEKLLAEQNATFKKKLAETKLKGKERLQAEKDKQKAKEQKRKDSEQRKKIRSRIAEDYNWLAQRLVKPKKDDFKHIPSDFVESVANLLEIFDFQTERSLQLEEKRGYASGATKAMRELKDKISKYSSPDGGNIFVRNDALDALVDECIELLDGRALRELEDNELQKVSEMLRAVRHMVKTQNELFVANRKATVAEAGESIISESAKKIEKYGRRYDRTGISGMLSHLLNETMMTPGNFFDSLGGTMKALYKNLRNAQDDYIRKVKFLRDFYKDLLGDYYKKAKPGSAVEDWQTQTNEFTLSDGSKLNITVAQAMSLYCLSKREQALGHILGSGIVLSDVTLDKGIAKVIGGKVQNTASGFRMTHNDVMNVISSLTDEQRRIADAIQNLMNTTLKEWGNETSLRLFDMEFFTEENYFPISVEQSELATEIGKGTEIKGNRITSFGMTKPLTEHANNKIIIGDIFSIAADHCNKMALYSAYAPSLIDFNRVYNYKQRNEDGTTGYSVKGMLKDAYSNKALKFIDNILDDINGQAKPRTDGLTAMINTSLANYKKAAIGLNLRVLVQQPTAIMRSLYMINPKYFTPDCFVGLKSAREEMHTHCPISAWKAWGNYQNDYTKNFEDVMLNKDWSKFDAVTMGAYGWADDMTWAVIWNAVKKEVKQKNPDVEAGSEEYWNLCNERASEIYDETQVVDSVFHRSDAMRNPDKLSKVVTSFMAEPTRTYNMVRSSVVKAYRSHKDGDNKAAAAELNKMLVVVVLNAAAVSAAAAVIDAFRGKGDDDDDETWLETFYRNFGENFKDNVNMLHNIVYVKDVVSLFENAIEGKYFSPSNMVFDGWAKLAIGVGDYEKVLSGDKSFIEWISGDFGAGIGYVTGIPTATFIKDTKALWNRLSLPSFASDGEEDTPSLWDYENNPLEVTDGTWADNVLNFFGINLTPEERAERDFKRTLKEVESKTKDLSGAEKKEAVNKIVMEGYTSFVEDGDFAKLKQMRRIIEAAGGDVEAFDDKVTKRTASEYKKTIGVEADMTKQAEMRQYLLDNGWTEAKISGEIVYKSNLAKDFKKACRELDIEKGTDVLTYLILAGITEADAYKLWENRNRGNFDTYSTGKYIAPTNGQITSGFGYRSSPTAGASSYHQGIDIAASRGSVVSAADGGRVVYAGYNGGYGNQIVIQHDDGTQTYYSHLDYISVRKGQSVSQKQYIGNVGSTGISTGPHLDFRVNVGGQFVDPLKYFSM